MFFAIFTDIRNVQEKNRKKIKKKLKRVTVSYFIADLKMLFTSPLKVKGYGIIQYTRGNYRPLNSHALGVSLTLSTSLSRSHATINK